MPDATMSLSLMRNIQQRLPRDIPIRLLLPELLKCYEWIPKDDPALLCRYLSVVEHLVSMLDSVTAPHYLQQVPLLRLCFRLGSRSCSSATDLCFPALPVRS